MQSSYILSLLEAIQREGVVLVPNIDAKTANKLVKSLEEYNCMVAIENYTSGRYFVVMEDIEKKIINGYLFTLK